MPLVDYEPPLVEGFIEAYGEDPRELDDRDRRWTEFRAGALTLFMREVRAEMDAVAGEQKRDRIGISAIVTSSEEENLFYGLDLKVWVRDGLIDTLIPYSSLPNFNSNDASWIDPEDARFFIELTRNHACRLALNIMPREMSAAEYRRRAAVLYQAGVEHLFFWDGAMGRSQHSDATRVVRRLGHRDEVTAWYKAGEPELTTPSRELTKLGDWDFGYVSPG